MIFWKRQTYVNGNQISNYQGLGMRAEKAMAPHSSTLSWKIPRMEEPGGLQSMGSLRVRHDWATSFSCIGEGNGNPLQYSCLENPRDRGAWWAAVHGVTQSWTRLKRLSSSNSSRDNGGEWILKGCKRNCLGWCKYSISWFWWQCLEGRIY